MQLTSGEIYEDSWRYNLDTYAVRASAGKWLPYRWLVYLAQELTAAILEGNARIIIEAPPRHGKSYTLSQWLPTWFLDMFSDKNVILTSYGADLATKFGKPVRDYFERGGDSGEAWTKLDPNQTRIDDWQTTDGGGMRSAGVGGGITGMGFDLGIIDDPHKDWADVQSAVSRERVIDWFNSTFYLRAEPGASIIVIQTRWNERDLAGYLQAEHADKWRVIRMPALAEKGDLLKRKVGQPLCPERWLRKDLLKKKRAIGSQLFAGMFQQRPSAEEGNIIKREWIQYYGGPTEVPLPKPVRHQLQSWDMNFKETKKGSYVVGEVWGDKGADVYLLDQVRGRWSFTKTRKKFIALTKQWPKALKKLVEDAANGPAIISDLKSVIRGIVPVPPRGSKTARLQAVSPMFEAGNVWFPHPHDAPWVRDLVEELVTFPNAEADDQVDSLSQALAEYKSSDLKAFNLNLDVGTQRPVTEFN